MSGSWATAFMVEFVKFYETVAKERSQRTENIKIHFCWSVGSGIG